MNPSLLPEREPPCILVVSSGSVGRRASELLVESGAQVARASAFEPLPALPGFGALALASDRPLPELEQRLDRQCWHDGVPWLSALCVAHEFRVGPVIVPGETPCHACFERRLRALAPELEVHDAIRALGGRGGDEAWFRGELEPLTEQVAALLAAEALALALGERVLPPRRLGRYWEGNALFGALRSGLVASVGTCELCVETARRPDTCGRVAEYFKARAGSAEACR